MGIGINELVQSDTLEVADVGGIVTTLYVGLDVGLFEKLHEREIRCFGGLADLEFISDLLSQDL